MRPTVRRNLVILLTVAVICLGMARLTSTYTRGTVIRELLAPLQGGVVQVWHNMSSSIKYFGRARQISQENDSLKQRLRELTWDNNRMHEYVYENTRLLKLLNFKERYNENFTFLGARVVSRAPNNWYSTMTVDRGKNDGLQVGQIVVSDVGLVGQVVDVGPNTAEVLLILDRNGAVGAMVQENRTLGVVEGNKDEPGVLRMVHLPYVVKLKQGQVVVTSGLGGIFPRGIPIGKITRFESQGNELDKFAVVEPFVDFDRLEELFIITQVKQVPADQAPANPLGQPNQTAKQ